LGYALDAAKNSAPERGPRDLARPESPKRILVIPTDEEGLIALDTAAIAAR
jgi:acetate kinase